MLFKINAVLLDYLVVNNQLYHLFLLFEFLQDLFLVFHPVIYRENFMSSVVSRLPVEPYLSKVVPANVT